MSSGTKVVDSHAPEVTNSETITSNSSGYSILGNVKESTKLVHKSNSTISKTVGDDGSTCSTTTDLISVAFFAAIRTSHRHVTERSETLGNITTERVN